MKNKYLLLFVFLMVGYFSIGQTYDMPNGANGTTSTCVGTFRDGAGNYASNANSTRTFCPSTPGDKVRITFTAFETESFLDYLDVWYANTVGAAGTQDDRFMGTPTLPFTITSTSPDGCLSFRFISDGSLEYAGFTATISCVTPCTPPIAALVNSSTVDICPSTSLSPGSSTVAFNASASTTTTGSVVRYEWDWGDGTSNLTLVPNTTHTFPTTGGLYVVRLRVRNNNFSFDPLGCLSTNSVTRTIRVMPEPSFVGTSASAIAVACGNSVTLNGLAVSQTIIQATPSVISGPINLPDGSGSSYDSNLDFSGLFTAGATVTAGCYPTVTFDIEHSYTGDLDIILIAPSGESVILFDQHAPIGPGHFGACSDGNTDGVPGCPATYSVVNSGGASWTAVASTTAAPPTVNGLCTYTGVCETGGSYYIPQIYSSTNPFTALNGASMNGVWTLQVIDNIGSDDGVLSNWSLTFPSSCYSSLQTITPDLATATWSHAGAGPAVPAQTTTSTVATNPGPACPSPGPCIGNQLANNVTIGPFLTSGSYIYSFTVTDEFGCQYIRNVSVNVAPCSSCVLSLTSAVSSNNQTVCINSAITSITYSYGGSATGAIVTGLPAGVTAVISGGLITISGTPTVSGTFNYTVTTVGCTPNLSLTGIINVSANPVLSNLTSNTPICINSNAEFYFTGTANSTVTYNIGGGASQTVVLNGTGNATVTVPSVISNTTLNTLLIQAAGAPIVGNGLSATGGNTPVNAAGVISALGAVADATNCASINNVNPTLTITLQHTVPAGTVITISIARNNNQGDATITGGGATTTFNAGPNDILQRITLTTIAATNTLTVTRTNGVVWADGVQYTLATFGCSSVISNSTTVVVNSVAIPTVGTVTATCSANGTASVSNYSAALTYTSTPAGLSVGAGGVISGFTCGTPYTITATNASTCTATSVSFTVQCQLVAPVVPTVGTVAATCSANGTASVSNYSAALTYTFTPAGLSVGAGGVISGFTCGTPYTITATNASTCTATSVSFTVQCQLVAPVVPTVGTLAATCSANGTASVSNYSAALTYTSTPAGLSVGAAGVISGFTCGTPYTITATNASTCTATSVSFTVQCQLVAPVVPTVGTVTATCSANGTASVSNYSAALTYTSTPAGLSVGAGGVISGFTCGTPYTITATNASTCTATSVSFTVLCQLLSPVVPTVGTVAATCSANGTASVSNYSAALTYTSTPAGLSVGAAGVISGFTCGTPYTITATNASTCTATSVSFTVQCQLVAPVVPTVGTVTATCSANGTASVSNYSAALTYTSTPAGLSVGAAGVISGFTCGTPYTITATNASTCTATSVSFTVQCQLLSPVVPTVGTVAATCSANGTASVSNYSAALTYTSTPAGLSVGAAGVISGFTCGTPYTITATNASTCTATSVSFTVQCQLLSPVVPTVGTVAATCSANGTASVSNYSAALTYTSTPAGLSVGAGGVVSGFTCGTAYTITATNASTCTATSASFTVQCQLVAPVVPTVATAVATCFANGTATVSNYSAALTYTSTPAGLSVGAGGVISGFTCGTPYTITATNASTCTATSVSFIVQCQLPKPVLAYTVTNPICDGSTLDFDLNSNVSGTTFDWSISSSYISQTGFNFSGTGESALNQIVHLLDPMADNGSIAVAIIPIANGCYGDLVTINLQIKPVPVATIVPFDNTLCSGETFHLEFTAQPSNNTTFIWTAVNNNGVLIPSGVYSGTSATGILDLQLTTAFPTLQGSIEFEITPFRNGCQGLTVSTGLIYVNPIPSAPILVPVTPICSSDPAGLVITNFDNTILEWEVVASDNVTGFVQSGSGQSPLTISDILLNITNNQGYVTYSVTSVSGDCRGQSTDFTVLVNPLPKPILTDGHICVNASTGLTYQGYVLDTQLTGSNLTYQWFVFNETTSVYDPIAGANASTYEVMEEGDYQVIVTNTTTGCIGSSSAEVNEVFPATAFTATVSDAFTNNSTITVTVNPIGTGSLIYALDEGAWQDSNIFTGVEAGEHTVIVSDLEGCTNLTIDVSVIDYPKYFTPNGDGIHDTWNIVGLNQADAKLYIFDRYGKLIKQISTVDGSKGWDGTYNGAQMPSTDYWFTIHFTENDQQKQFKSHFSLKR